MAIDVQALALKVRDAGVQIIKGEAVDEWNSLVDADKQKVQEALLAVGRYLVLQKTDPAAAEVEKPFADVVVKKLEAIGSKTVARTVTNVIFKVAQIVLPLLLAAI